jgi:hypothetical protein
VDLTFHESDERLELYALDRLSDSDLIRTEEHLLVCDLCRERLDVTANFALAIRDELKSRPLLKEEIRSGWFSWLEDFGKDGSWMRPQFALGGALALALVSFVAFRSGNHPLAPVATLQLTAMRGTDFKTVAPARELDITFGDAPPSTGQLAVEVVDANGSPVWQGPPQVEKAVVRARIAKELKPGEYYARLYDSPGHLVHEYGFRVK